MMFQNYGYQYGYTTSADLDGMIQIQEGQIMSGYTIGILIQDVHYPLIPGNVANASTYNYPVKMEIVPGADQKRTHTGDKTLLPEIIKSCRRLEAQGVRAIVGACGYFGNFQKEVAEAVDIPVYLSSVIQIPWIRAGLKKGREIGIICADLDHFSDHIYEQCGVSIEDRRLCHVAGAGKQPEFSALLERRGFFDNAKLEQEIVDLAVGLKNDHPDLGAILLECSDMPPYAASVQKAVQLPVYDYMTMIDYVHSVVAHRHFYGFI